MGRKGWTLGWWGERGGEAVAREEVRWDGSIMNMKIGGMCHVATCSLFVFFTDVQLTSDWMQTSSSNDVIRYISTHTTCISFLFVCSSSSSSPPCCPSVFYPTPTLH